MSVLSQEVLDKILERDDLTEAERLFFEGKVTYPHGEMPPGPSGRSRVSILVLTARNALVGRGPHGE